MPRELVDVPLLLPAVRKALEMGLSFQPAAALALDAVERWLRLLPPAAVQPHLPHVLPSLREYIRPPRRAALGSEVAATLQVRASLGALMLSSRTPSRACESRHAPLCLIVRCFAFCARTHRWRA